MPNEGSPTLPPPSGFADEAAALGIEFEPGEIERLGRFLALLLECNRRFNLTAVTDPDEAWRRHVLDSLTMLPLLASSGPSRVIDVGSGGGLPGVPLAIVMPAVHFTLLEATGKKARFLEDTVGELGLGNVRVINERAETLAHDRETHREQYDAVVARAVGPLAVLLELTIPFAKIGGHVLAIKGRRAEEEIREAGTALHLLHAAVTLTHRTPTGTLVIIEKQRKTPRTYPRRPGEPKRAPLGPRRA